MSSTSKKISQLPPDAQKRAKEFVDFLYERYVKKETEEPESSDELENSSFFGIWKSRDEMKDPTKWVRNVRKTHWRNDKV